MKVVLFCGVSNETKVNELKEYANSKGITEYEVLPILRTATKPISKRVMWGMVKDYFEGHTECDTIIVSSIGKLVRTLTELEEIKAYMETYHKTLYIMDTDLLVYEKGKITKIGELCFNQSASMAIEERNNKIERLKR